MAERRRRAAGGGRERLETSGELLWPRGSYVIVSEPQGLWGEKWYALPRKDVQLFLEADPPPPWEFEKTEFRTRPPGLFGFADEGLLGRPYGRHVSVYRVPWPSAGVFAPSEGSSQERYSPMSVAGEILLDVQRIRVPDAKSLLRFVNRWGVLGVGIPGAPGFDADGVALTGEWIVRLGQWVETLNALKRGTAKKVTWAQFAATLNEQLGGVHPLVRVTDHGLEPTFRAERVLDVLCFELWDQATGGKRLRRCPECDALFVPRRANQENCTRLCANRPTVRKWKLAQKRKKAMADREKED